MVEVVGTEEFEGWFLALDEKDSEAVTRVVGLLEAQGVALKFPYSSQVKGSEYALRELRVKSSGDPLRIIYAFDPKRQVVLILGADKCGDDRFYDWAVPKAEKRWRKYLAEKEYEQEAE